MIDDFNDEADILSKVVRIRILMGCTFAITLCNNPVSKLKFMIYGLPMSTRKTTRKIT